MITWRLKSLQVIIYHAKSVREALGAYKVGDITEKVIREFAKMSLSSGLKNATVNRRLHIISQCLKTARTMATSHLFLTYSVSPSIGNARQGFFTTQKYSDYYHICQNISRILPSLPISLAGVSLRVPSCSGQW